MSLRILFVEKDVTTTDLLVPSLLRQGYLVSIAHTQRQATSSIRGSRPDLLIVDVVSFGSRGYKITEAVRDQLPGTATILLLPDGHDPAGSSAEAFMTPPFTSRRLLYRVKKLASTLPDHDIRAGSFALDPDTRTLRKGDTVVQLRPKEAALLALFMRSRGRVLSRREIMKEVWETEYLGDTDTLNVHVCWLRLKIEDEPSRPLYLRTVRGVGYRFDIPESSQS